MKLHNYSLNSIVLICLFLIMTYSTVFSNEGDFVDIDNTAIVLLDCGCESCIVIVSCSHSFENVVVDFEHCSFFANAYGLHFYDVVNGNILDEKPIQYGIIREKIILNNIRKRLLRKYERLYS